MNKTYCGHASGVTYVGCMKCDLDRQADIIRKFKQLAEELSDKEWATRDGNAPADVQMCIDEINNILSEQ